MAFTNYFEHEICEKEIYRKWEESGSFIADVNSDRPPFSISMPPPNATGHLHLGHGITLAIEDLVVRWKRMSGFEVLWLPGTDHAAIASENRMIQELQKEGIRDPRNTLGRDELVRRIADYVESSRGVIRSQIRSMGASCDWSRERYTMDAGLTRSVAAIFSRMYLDGLIFRGPRIINWDPVLQTTVSDDEIEHVDRTAKFYTIKYGPFLIGTSRPETKLGDTGVAVHPDDPRWNEYIGKKLEISWPKGPVINVEVVADAKNVDMNTGTGAVGLTPAHSQIDFEIAQANSLPLIQVIGEDGKMTAAAGPYEGMTVLDCREAFVQDLKEAGLLVKEEEYTQSASICYRSKATIEPLPKNQWFVDVNKPAVHWKGKLVSLRQVLKDVVETEEVEIIPAYEKKKYFHWVDNLHDWCISRQIWWGHRIPVWYRGEEECHFGIKEPEGNGWIQDPDTLDTWFSAALWTWGTLIDESLIGEDLNLKEILEKSPDFRRFHPTGLMETGYDILFFWVARMIMMTTYMTGEIPFQKVYLHGLILDRDGDKMSKTKPETSIDPVTEIAENGADSLRLALIQGSTAGRDTKFSKDQILASKRLINKLWNAAKLVHMKTSDKNVGSLPADIKHPVNRWILNRTQAVTDECTNWLNAYNLNEAAETIRRAFWGEFCDFYLEAIKCDSISGLDETPAVLRQSLDCFLRLFHPFTPFVTEQIWSELGHQEMLINSAWPVTAPESALPAEEGAEAVIRLISEIRRIRSENSFNPSAKVETVIQIKKFDETFRECEDIIYRMARTSSIDFVAPDFSFTDIQKTATIGVDRDFVVAVFLGTTDLEEEKSRLLKQLEDEKKTLAALNDRLANEQFLARANSAVIEKTKKDASKMESVIASINERLDSLNGKNES